MRRLPAGFIEPCLPTSARQPRTGAEWVHEIKHDDFRVIARKDGDRVRLYSRPGNSLTDRFPLIVEALAGLRSRSCIIDGEAVCCDHKGVPSFDRLRYRRSMQRLMLWAIRSASRSRPDKPAISTVRTSCYRRSRPTS
jgi:bifunctional non-homologous end joining protein LigD